MVVKRVKKGANVIRQGLVKGGGMIRLDQMQDIYAFGEREQVAKGNVMSNRLGNREERTSYKKKRYGLQKSRARTTDCVGPKEEPL